MMGPQNIIEREHRLQAKRFETLFAELDTIKRQLAPDGLEAKIEAVPGKLAKLLESSDRPR